MTYLLWTLQVLLAILFLFGGVVKLLMPGEQLVAQTGVPAALMYFVSVCEILGGLGLLLPGLFRIRTGLTPLAAIGLIMIMIGAVTITLLKTGIVAAMVPLITGILLAFVAYSRWRLAPLKAR